MMIGAPSIDLQGLSQSSKALRIDQRVGITIYPHGSDPVFGSRSTSPRKLNWKRGETEGGVTSFSWSKRLGEPAGKWAATVKLGRDASLDIMGGDVLGGDWVDVVVLRNGVEFPLCRGRIDTVRQDDHSDRGATVRTLTISGADHGSLMDTMTAWNNIHVQTLAELAFGIFTFKIDGAPGGSPADVFEAIIRGVFGNKTGATQSAWTLPPALHEGDHVKYFLDALDVRKSGTIRGAYYNENALWTNPGEQLKAALQRWCNPLLNEMIVDLDPFEGSQMFAEIRERPFISTIYGADSPWWQLPEWELPQWAVDSKSLGRSDHERYTIYQINADMQYFPSMEQAAMSPPLYSLAEIERHGIRPRQETTQFMVTGEDGDWAKERETWQRLLADWNAMNPYWLSGNVEAKLLLPEFRVGDRFRLRGGTPADDLIGYIEGIDMTFRWAPSSEAGPSGSTSLQLTRGFQGTDRDLFRSVVDAAAAYTEVF